MTDLPDPVGSHGQHVVAPQETDHGVSLAGTPLLEPETLSNPVEALIDHSLVSEVGLGELQVRERGPRVGAGQRLEPLAHRLVENHIAEVVGDELVGVFGVVGPL